MAMNSATQALSTRLVEAASMDDRLLELQRVLDLDAPPRRLECFDISHTGGEKAVASCVVFNEQGPLKSAYRKRSEEHTSELQSLMRNSYAVFCLKKKTTSTKHHIVDYIP